MPSQTGESAESRQLAQTPTPAAEATSPKTPERNRALPRGSVSPSPEPIVRKPLPPTSPAPLLPVSATEVPLQPLPDHKGKDPAEFWLAYFEANRPHPEAVREKVRKLSEAVEREHVIGLLQAALINGQSQPWMYEVLALSMELQKRPKEEVERVVMSFTDFGQADFDSMCLAGAYLTRLNHEASALRMYRQASRMESERPEPYVLGLKLAVKAHDMASIRWASCGILEHCWTTDHALLHQEAEDQGREAIRQMKLAKQTQEAEQFEQALATAKIRDLVLRLEWSGKADLDMTVQEPLGSICGLEQPVTTGGGVLAHDGFYPNEKNCYEEYVAAKGFTGEYQVRVHRSWGEVVGQRATLSVIKHQGTKDEVVQQHVFQLQEKEPAFRFRLEGGRRRQERSVPEITASSRASLTAPPRRRFYAHHSRTGQDDQPIVQVAVGAAQGQLIGQLFSSPTIRVIPEGTTVTASVIVSPDRRYVRLGISPQFSSITDVFTFSYLKF